MLHYWRFCASSFTLLAPCSTLAAASFFVSSAFDEPQPSHELPFSLAFSTVSSAVFCRESGAGQAKWEIRNKKWRRRTLVASYADATSAFAFSYWPATAPFPCSYFFDASAFAPSYFCSAWAFDASYFAAASPYGSNQYRGHEE